MSFKNTLIFGLFIACLLGVKTSGPEVMRGAYIPMLTFGSEQVFRMDRALQASLTPETSPYGSYKEVIADVVRPKIAFSGVGFTWNEYIPEKTSAAIFIRLLQSDTWSDWMEVPRDIDHKNDDEKDLGPDGLQDAFLPMNRTDAYQYKVVLQGNGKDTPTIKNIKVTVINAEDSPGVVAQSHLAAQITQDMIAPNRVQIISRGQWGADENLRVYHGDLPEAPVQRLDSGYQDKFSDELQIVRKITANEKGELLSWPQEYPAKISKIIVHHTASTANLDNPKKALRDIYSWHTKGRGWGDIGYNYIIDPYGNIYEGRAGGEMVVGAHAGRANTGSIGISVMGNYETGDVSEKSLVALTRLISEKTKIHGIDPTGRSGFRGQTTANLLGHRDVMSTSCPGKSLYDKLPLVAQLAKSSIKTTVEDAGFKKQKEKGYDFEDISGLLYVDLNPEQVKNLTITLKNTGTATWNDATSVVVNDISAIKEFMQVQTPPGRVTFPMNGMHMVYPGGTANFTVTLVGGFKSSMRTISIVPVINGKTKLNKRMELSVQTTPAQFTYDLVSTSSVPPIMKSGEKFAMTIDLKNTGNVSWQNKGSKTVKIGTEKARDRATVFLTPPSARAGSLTQDIVRPGEVGHFILNLTAPKATGNYKEHFAPVVEGITWMTDKNIFFSTFVYEKDIAAESGGIAQIDAFPNSTQVATVKLKNVGGTTWNFQNTPQLRKTGASRLKILSSSLQDVEVKPGATGTFIVQVAVPSGFKIGKVKADVYIGSIKATLRPITINAKRVSVVQTPSSPIFNTSPFTPIPTAQTPQAQIISSGSSDSSKGNNVRVLLSFSGTPVVSGNGSFTVKSGSYSASFQRDTKVTIQPQNGVYEILANNFFQIVNSPVQIIPDSGTILRVDNWERRASWDNSINDNEFRGILEVRTDGARPIVINELPIEDYLKGLAETLNGDPVEKKKAITIAARNYVLYYSTVGKGTKFPGKPYDVDDDPAHSQKYTGYGYEKRSPNSVATVEATRGIVIKYKGQVVRAPYFSSDAGRTISAASAWSWKDADFLLSVDDPYCAGMSQAGHGVGMSGCGSLGMAKSGKTYEDILHYYYQNVTIEKVY